jgi:hypothetical protein
MLRFGKSSLRGSCRIRQVVDQVFAESWSVQLWCPKSCEMWGTRGLLRFSQSGLRKPVDRKSHRPGQGYELIKGCSPALVGARLLVLFSCRFVALPGMSRFGQVGSALHGDLGAVER